jgi:hypothetical protein
MIFLLLLLCQISSISSHKSPFSVRAPQSPSSVCRFLHHSRHHRTHPLIQIAFDLRGGSSSSDEDSSSDIESNGDEEEDETNKSEMKHVKCVLCGQEIIASSQEDCEAHMAVCPAFARVHPEHGETNPEGVYPPKGTDNSDVEENTPEPKDIDSMSVKELRSLILQSGLSDKDCIEKADLKERAKEALELK